MDSEVMERAERVLWIWTAGEVALFAWLLWVLWTSLSGGATPLVSLSRPLLLAGLAFAAFQLLVPLVVFLDVRRREDDPGYLWVHVSAMPLLNVFGLVGYLEERRRRTRTLE